MIYLNNNTSAQTINIPFGQPDVPVHKKVQEVKDYSVSEGGQFVIEPDSGYTSMGRVDLNVDASGIFNSGYTSGYSAGTEAQKAKLTAVTITENGQYNRPDGYSAVTVNVDESQSYQSGYTEGYRQGEQMGFDIAADRAARNSVGLTISANGQYNATITEDVKGYITGVSVNVVAVGKLPAFVDGTLSEAITTADLNGITRIKDYGLAYLPYVPSIELPNTVNEIGSYAFRDCTSMTSITIPSGVTTIGMGAFTGCTALKKVTIPSRVTTISQYLFGNCTSLEQVEIPEGVINVDGYSFASCRSLTELVLPSTLNSMSIRLDNYNGGFGLKDLYLKSPTKVSLNGTYNANYMPTGVTVWVPAGIVSNYTADSNWSRLVSEKSWEIKAMVN